MKITPSKPMRILSIEAWGSGWDSCYKVRKIGEITIETLESLKTDEAKLQYMFEKGYINGVEEVAIEDDKFNYLIIDKNSGAPISSIEYGPHH